MIITCDTCFGAECIVCNNLGWFRLPERKQMSIVDVNPENKEHKRVIGTIIHIEMPTKDDAGANKGGYGFIISEDIPLVRIFFHWTAMLHNTTPFIELKEGMRVEFIAAKHYDKMTNEYQGYRALKVKVLPDDESK